MSCLFHLLHLHQNMVKLSLLCATILFVIIIPLTSIYANSCASVSRTKKLNIRVTLGKIKATSFSRLVGKRGRVQKSNSTVSSKADSQMENIVAPLSTCNGNDITLRSRSSSNMRRRKLDYELAVKESSRIYNEIMSMCKQ